MLSLEAASLAHEVADAVRARLEITRPLSDIEVFQVAVLSSCNDSDGLLEFAFDKALSRELKPQAARAAVTRNEWMALFSNLGTTACRMVHLGETQNRIESGLAHTLQENDQRARWSRPMTKLLVYVALNSKEDVEEKVGYVLGELIRTDSRRLEDLRTTLETSGCDVVLLSMAVRAVAEGIGL